MSRLLLLVTALLFSTGGAAIKATSLASWQVACFRSGVAALALLILAPGTRAGWSRRLVPVALAYASTLTLFVLANKLTTAANAVFLQSTAPLYLLLLGPLLLHERIRRSDLVLISAVALGMGLFFVGRQPALLTAPNPLHGNVLAAVSGVTWALTVVGLRWLSGRAGASPAAAVLAGNVMVCVACLPLALPVAHGAWQDAGVILYLGIFQIGLAYACLTRAIRHVPALEASLLLLLEPVLKTGTVHSNTISETGENRV